MFKKWVFLADVTLPIEVVVMPIVRIQGIRFLPTTDSKAFWALRLTLSTKEIICRSGDKIHMFCESGTLALESLLQGALGWVGGVVNVLSNEHVHLLNLLGLAAT